MGMYINIPTFFILHIKHKWEWYLFVNNKNSMILDDLLSFSFWVLCFLLVVKLRPWYLEEFAMSWAAGHRKVKQNSGQSSSTVHTDTFPVQQLKWKYWNFFTFYLILKSLVFQFPFLHVQIYIAQYSIKYCHWIDWWPVLKLDFREFNQPSEDHQIKVTFLLSVLTFSRRFTYRILLMTFFENVSEI